jgi:hypothetical protein
MDCFASLAMTARAMDCFAEPVIGRALARPRRVESAHRSASVTEIFVEQAVHVEADFLNRFNESARRANHPKVCKAPLAKIF